MSNLSILINPEIMKLDKEYKLLSKELEAAEIIIDLKSVWSTIPNGTVYEKELFRCILKAETDSLILRKQLRDSLERMFSIMNRMQRNEIQV